MLWPDWGIGKESSIWNEDHLYFCQHCTYFKNLTGKAMHEKLKTQMFIYFFYFSSSLKHSCIFVLYELKRILWKLTYKIFHFIDPCFFMTSFSSSYVLLSWPWSTCNTDWSDGWWIKTYPTWFMDGPFSYFCWAKVFSTH